jgi:hypothetical protein
MIEVQGLDGMDDAQKLQLILYMLVHYGWDVAYCADGDENAPLDGCVVGTPAFVRETVKSLPGTWVIQ